MLLCSSLGLVEFSLSSSLARLQFFFLFFFWLGHNLGYRMGPNLVGLNEARGVGLGSGKKNPFDNRAKSGPMGPVQV